MSETNKMQCKRCGANENRIHGFCSMECETAWYYEDDIRDLTARITELEEKQCWIPVSQPPTKSGKYNVLIKWKYGKVVDTAAYMTKATILGNHWFNDKYTGSEYFVTHWMPLPQPPEVTS